MTGRPLLEPLPADVALPRPHTHDINVPAPDRWRRRAGPDVTNTWTMAGLRWGEPSPRPPLVLVHGLVVAARMCAPTARRLAVGGTVLAPDLPGCGRSSKPYPVPTIPELGAALASWLPAATAGPAVLVGVSVGTQIVIDAAVRASHRVSAVVLVSPTVDRQRRRWCSQLWRWQLEQATQSMRMKRIQFSDYRRGGVGRGLRTFRAALADRPEDKLPRLTMPVLICRGTRDPLVSSSWVRELCGHARDARLAILPGTVHAMSHDNPVELSRAVLGFLDDMTRGRGGEPVVLRTEVPR
ncbi:alpha/beta hydrolase [Micromonospora sp. NPDC047707]|uniref:alpha/beta fold hydrolase n=1 Tax=Micromonospora sp. NPDC047707 TaxID=3154498 RepID=UPI003452CE4D